MNLIKVKIVNRLDELLNNKVFVILVIIFTVIFAGYYYFGILDIVIPTGEDCIPTYHRYLNDLAGKNTIYAEKEILLTITGTIAYKISGLSFNTIRLLQTMRYCMVIFVALLVIFIVKKNKECIMCFLPIFYIFMVELPGFTKKSNFGFIDTPFQDIIHYYPANYHTDIIAVSLLCALLTALVIKSNDRNYQFILAGIIAVISLYYIIHYGDILFIALYIMPVAIIAFLNLVKSKKYFKYVINGFILFLLALIFTKIMPVTSNLHVKIWSSAQAEIYGNVYGAMNWREIDNLSDALSETFRMIIQLFGMDRYETTVLSAWTLIVLFKAVLLLIAVIIIISVIVTLLNGTSEQKGYDIIDQICAIGIIILLFVKIFTEYNYSYSLDRFFWGIVVNSTILIVRNITNAFNTIFNGYIVNTASKRVSVFLIGGLISLLAFNNVWAYEKIDNYSDDMLKCIDYIKENGDGYAIAKFTLASRMAIHANGEVLFFESQEQHKDFLGGDEKPRYVISNTDDDTYWPLYDTRIYAFVEENEEPLKTVKFGDIWLHVLY